MLDNLRDIVARGVCFLFGIHTMSIARAVQAPQRTEKKRTGRMIELTLDSGRTTSDES